MFSGQLATAYGGFACGSQRLFDPGRIQQRAQLGYPVGRQCLQRLVQGGLQQAQSKKGNMLNMFPF